MRDPRPRTFDDFWPFYVSQHRRPGTRTMHFIGTTLGEMASEVERLGRVIA